ncbi:MAG: ferrous iron transport protein A [Kiritimatiellae bacterium]|nr:ferrous iron transport protein A [Kiritimatiellia bacterium]
MPLSMLGPGNRRKIVAVKGDDSVRKHLGELGFVEGADVEVIADNGGNLIVGVYGARLALNADLARRILV